MDAAITWLLKFTSLGAGNCPDAERFHECEVPLWLYPSLKDAEVKWENSLDSLDSGVR